MKSPEAPVSPNANPATRDLLSLSLETAVPIWINELQEVPFEELMDRAKTCGWEVAEKADTLLYGSKKIGGTAEVFNRLAEGLAILSFVPGGVNFLGRHWEAKHKKDT